jgi:hypothetical protein
MGWKLGNSGILGSSAVLAGNRIFAGIYQVNLLNMREQSFSS